MRSLLATLLTLALLPSAATARQTAPARRAQDDEEVVRITSALVQTDVVVTDKNDAVVTDLKMEDFEVYENGKRQELKFMEFVSAGGDRRAEGARPEAEAAAEAELASRGLSAKDVRRVIAFVVDDLTVPYQDMVTVRQILTDFVDNQMREGDLVAIVRTVGGKGLLQQFTTDRALLRRAIATLNIATHPFSINDPPSEGRMNTTPVPAGSDGTGGRGEGGGDDATARNVEGFDIANPNDDVNRLYRGLFSLSTSLQVIDGLKRLPGRKSLVLFSGGIPIFETGSTGTAYSNVSYLINRLADEAARSGVVINTMDPRGMRATAGVVGYRETPAISGSDPRGGMSGFGRGGPRIGDPTVGTGRSELEVMPLGLGAEERLSLQTLSEATGGVSVVNTNNMRAGLEKVLARSAGYYVLAYSPAEKFDNKFRELKVKVRRDGLRVYSHRGYLAREDPAANQPRTKEQAVLAASLSPLARRDIEVSANYTVRLQPSNRAALGIDLSIDPKRLSFREGAGGTHQTSLDVVGFVYDQLGRLRGGFSETLNLNLTPENYQRALSQGIPYSANTELPPGYYQVRSVVREAETGRLGTSSRYLEIPDLSSGRLAVSSLLLFAADPSKPSAAPEPLDALRQISQKRDLRYALSVFNAKNKQLRTQLIISRGGKVLFQEPEQPLKAEAGAQYLTRVGQLGLAKVPPGRYLLTLVVTDPSADKKTPPQSRSVEFTVVP